MRAYTETAVEIPSPMPRPEHGHLRQSAESLRGRRIGRHSARAGL